MSDPKAPNDPIGDDAVDPVDRAYAEAEAMLRDDAERAARRARVLGAVAAAQTEPQAAPEPAAAPVASSLPPPRKTAWQPAPWLMAAGVAGVATLVGLRIAPTAVERPTQIRPAPASSAPTPPPPQGAVQDAAPLPTATPPAPAAKLAPPPPVPARARVAAPMESPPPLPIPPVQRRVETSEPPPPLPIPPVERRVEAPAPPTAMAPVYGELLAPFDIANPDWARRPSDEDVARYYPDRARRTETNGSATISCTVTAKGTLVSCKVVSETPENYGFGDAAIKLSRLFRMKPTTANGASVDGGTVRVPIAFKLPN